MASLPTDRTKLNAAVANQQPSVVASSKALREALMEGTDTTDLLFQRLMAYQAGVRYFADGGSFTDTTFQNTIDGGTFA